MKDNASNYIVGAIENFAKKRGWFFGAFMDNPMLRSDLVEVARQKIPNLSPSKEQQHFHKESVEINIIISGWIRLSINGEEFKLQKDDFFVVWPYSIVSNVTTGDDTELIVIRAPSHPHDKYIL